MNRGQCERILLEHKHLVVTSKLTGTSPVTTSGSYSGYIADRPYYYWAHIDSRMNARTDQFAKSAELVAAERQYIDLFWEKSGLQNTMGKIYDYEFFWNEERSQHCDLLVEQGTIPEREEFVLERLGIDLNSFPRLLLLDDQEDYSYVHRRLSLSQFLEMNFYGLGELREEDAFTLFKVFLVGREIGDLWQDEEDQTWTASPVKVPGIPESQWRTAKGFAHEFYAAQYLTQVAAGNGLLSGTNYVFEMTV